VRRICVISGSRSEFGLLKPILSLLDTELEIDLQLVATGMHLSDEYGLTVTEIENSGFKINAKVESLIFSGKSIDIPSSVAKGITGIFTALKELKPELVVVLGDRYEIFAAVIGATLYGAPIAHIQGGEVTSGSIDDVYRHAITKMSHLHFASTDKSKKRIQQLGENEKSIFVVGALGAEIVNNLKFASKSDLEEKYNFKFGVKNLLVTLHPSTFEELSNLELINSLLLALSGLRDTHLIFTYPTADLESDIIINEIEKFSSGRSNAFFIKSLGQLDYLACVAQVDGVVGNSSSGILEVPSLRKGTINIGDRQQGREQSGSIINSNAHPESIISSIEYLYSQEFQQSLANSISPYFRPMTSVNIVEVLARTPLDGLTRKKFFDLE